MKDIPVYRFPAEHARENGELELYRASNKASAACKEAIEKAISEHYCDMIELLESNTVTRNKNEQKRRS